MALSFCVLGSGSGGNSTLVVCQNGEKQSCFLIDCGLSPRATASRLASVGLTLDDIGSVFLTHFDTDHFCPSWIKVIQRRNLPVHFHRSHRAAAWRAGLTAQHGMLFEKIVPLECGATASPLLLAHDDLGSVGFVIEHGGLRLGYATDLGRVPHDLFQHFTKLDALAIESNYDREMQLASDRPIYLKRRIMGGRGHLSNAQSFEAVYRIAETSSLSHIATLHLSRQCNDPRRVRALYEREAPHLVDRLTITNQYQPTPMLAVTRHVAPDQLAKRHGDRQRRQPLEQHVSVQESHSQLRLFAERPPTETALTT